MPAPQPLPETGVFGQLLAEGYRFNFFQAVRLLTLCEPHRAPVGHDASPRQEVVRFGAHASMEFPASQIDEIVRHGDPDRPPQMAVNFFGLTTPISGLPQHYTEIVLERLARKDRALLEFLNLFNHRLLSLFYRAWEKYHFWITAEHALLRERTALSAGGETLRNFVVNERPQLDPLGQVLLSLVGLGNPAARYVMSERDHLVTRTGIADQTWRFYAGLLSQRHRSAIGLESLLSDHFGWPVRVQALVGRWLHLEAADRTRLKRGGNTRLGRETVAGQKVWEVQGKFRLRIGPLGYEQFCRLLPIGDAHEPLTQLTRFYAGQHLDFDLELQLHAAEIPPLRCGDRTGIGARLGWNTWLPAGHRSHQTASVILRTAGEQSE